MRRSLQHFIEEWSCERSCLYSYFICSHVEHKNRYCLLLGLVVMKRTALFIAALQQVCLQRNRAWLEATSHSECLTAENMGVSCHILFVKSSTNSHRLHTDRQDIPAAAHSFPANLHLFGLTWRSLFSLFFRRLFLRLTVLKQLYAVSPKPHGDRWGSLHSTRFRKGKPKVVKTTSQQLTIIHRSTHKPIIIKFTKEGLQETDM